MKYTGKTLGTLEFDRIKAMLADCASTDGAKARALSLMPVDDIDTVNERQSRTEDAKRLINAKGYPAFGAKEEVGS